MIYVVTRATGQYSDYRCENLFYCDDEDTAKLFCEKAQEIARHLEVKRQEIWDGYDHFDDSDASMKDWSKREKKEKKLEHPMDECLGTNEFDDVSYSYQCVTKWSQQ